MTWNTVAKCKCDGGGFSLDEFEVSLRPVVMLWPHYSSDAVRRATISDEMEHVLDLSIWGEAERLRAEELESSQQSRIYSTESECAHANRQILEAQMASGFRQAAVRSGRIRHANGGHGHPLP